LSSIDDVVRFIQDTTWDTLPDGVRHQVRLCLIDALGATLSGTLTRASEIASQYAAAVFPGDDATILMKDTRASAAGVAFANGTAANALDIDDGGKYTKGHPGAQVFPTALSLAEKLGRSGKEFLTAMVVGYEIAHRIGRCWHDSHAVYQACGSWGSVANAATAAHLMELSADQIKHALGIAEYHAPNLPMMRDIDHPGMVKHGIGWGALTGIVAAELASRGFTGIRSLLSIDDYQSWVRDLGDRYIMAEPNGVLFKEFSCCRWVHAALYAAKALSEREPVPIEAITRIRVTSFSETVRLRADVPTTTEEAQFNSAWPLAAMLVDGEVGPSQILDERLDDERILALVRKTELVESQAFTELAELQRLGDARGRYAADLEITMDDGRTLHQHAVVPDAGERFGTRRWAEEKFRLQAGHVLTADQIAEIIALAWSLDATPRVTELIQALQETSDVRSSST
jgi:2-methylcitrate dehydratase PrpD